MAEDIEIEVKKKALDAALEITRPSGALVVSAEDSEVKYRNAEDVIGEAEKIYQWLIK